MSANSVANASFKIDFDDNGTKTELSYGYEPSLQDTQRLVSIVSDLPAYMNERFGVGKDFKHREFNENARWIDPEFRENLMSSIVKSARADAIEYLMKNENNVNFSRNSLQGVEREVHEFPVGPQVTDLDSETTFNNNPKLTTHGI
jgi:hypothetical protein